LAFKFLRESDMKRLVIIDGKSVFYRGYYAMPGLAAKDGTPTGGVYGFTTLSLEVIKRLHPDYVAVAWDKSKTNIRSRLKIYPAYKAGRKPAPPDFYAQIPILHELLDAFGWPLYELDDYEADDIMAGLAEQAKTQNIETILITSDLDVLQCINEHVKVYALKKGLSNIEEFHPESFVAKYGIEPNQFLDLKALKGDASDNIPGVPGIGEKTALDLLKQYKTLDGVYENIELLPKTVHNKLVAGKDLAILSKKLVTLFTDAPIKLDLKALDIKNFDVAKLKANLEKLEFRSLLRRLPDVGAEARAMVADAAPGGDLRLPKLVAPGAFRLDTKDVLYINVFAHGAQGSDPYAVILGSKEQATLFELPKNKAALLKLKTVLETTPLAGYDVKKQLKSLQELGIKAKNVAHDCQVAAFLLDSLHISKTLHSLAKAEIDYELADATTIPPEDIGQHTAELVGVLVALHQKQVGQLAAIPKLEKLAKEVEWPVINVLAAMEERGIALDSKYLVKMSRKMEDQISDIEQTIYGYANQEFNISSPQQLAKVLFEDMGLPASGVKKGKAGVYSTAANELDKLRSIHPIIDYISQYREYTKLKSTYVDALPKLVAKDGRVHTTFNLTVTQTGRLSSSDPNLQNIPVRSELGKTIRTAFVAGRGNVFVSADYSQFELRLAAYLAGDGDMIEVFNSGADIHIRTASEIYGIALEDVTKRQRNNAKTINFGILYGMSPHGLANATGMSFESAKEFIDRYFATRQPLVDYIEQLKKQAEEQGYVETMFGRRRPTPDVKSPIYVVREAALRQAVNMPIQGTEADLMKMAMIKIEQTLPKDCQQLLQIHDSILVECPAKKAGQVADLLKDTMENIYPELGVRLAVEIHTGKNWGEL
jgi:DNA polymerase-1